MSSPFSLEYIIAKRIQVRTQLKAARAGELVTCACGRAHPVYELYRCRWCDEFYCRKCAAEHFGGDASKEAHDAAIRGVRVTALRAVEMVER